MSAARCATFVAMANITTKLPNGVLFEARKPTTAEWDRYVEKIRRGEIKVGQRELVQLCSTSHTPEEASKLLARYPGAIKPIATGLDELAQGPAWEDDAFVSTEDGTSIGGVLFRAPTLEEWEALQDQMEDRDKRWGEITRIFLLDLTDAKADATKLFEDYPACVQVIGREIGKLVGQGISITVKKD